MRPLNGLPVAIVFTVGGTDVSAGPGILATVCLGLYIASFAISLVPVFWLMISEVYPLGSAVPP